MAGIETTRTRGSLDKIGKFIGTTHEVFLLEDTLDQLTKKAQSGPDFEDFPAPFPRLRVTLPLVSTEVCAGFPSPADDHQERAIDLNEEIIQNEAATFYYRVIGESGHDSLTRDGYVRPGDIAVVDRSLTPRHGDVVLAVIDGEQCFKRFCKQGKQVWLESANLAYPTIEFHGDCVLMIEGVMTWSLHKQRR